MKTIQDGACTFTHQGKDYTALGAWLTEQGGAVYIVGEKGALRAETWNGDLISANVQVVSEWEERRGPWPYRMRSVRFSVANMTFSGRYGCDWAQLCRVRRVKGVR